MTDFIISDTHFGHANMMKFLREDGSPLRNFESVEQHDQTLVDNWNAVIKDTDTVYHLGDVVMNRKHLSTMEKLNGKKYLVLGNHDVFPHEDYLKYFRRLHGSLKLDRLILSHIPLHADSIPHWALGCVHGHIHAQQSNDHRYYNACVEHTNYAPVTVEQVVNEFKLRMMVNEA